MFCFRIFAHCSIAEIIITFFNKTRYYVYDVTVFLRLEFTRMRFIVALRFERSWYPYIRVFEFTAYIKMKIFY